MSCLKKYKPSWRSSFAKILPRLPWTPSSKKDLGADSLDILQLLMRIEDQYGIVIPDQELAKFETVGDVVNYLEQQEVKL